MLNAGCDAVYLSGKNFGARAYAGNFTREELHEAIVLCHLLGRKVYVTVNTLIKDRELPELREFLSFLEREKADGVIVQDPGVIHILKEEFPGLKIHISTQMSVTGVRTARTLKKQGAVRIVPARELSLSEIRAIRETGIEVEVFVHGAMCYCYSGQCLLSSVIGGRSGNRGRCSQPCRLPYRSFGEGIRKERYLLSMKDLYALPILPDLLHAGVDSLKIEGRMKKSEYAAGVTAVYRKYLDLCYRDEFDGIEEEDEIFLRHLYLRSDISEGYFFRHNGGEMITQGSPSYSGADEEVLKRIREDYLSEMPKVTAEARIFMETGKPVTLTLNSGGSEVTVQGPSVLAAEHMPLTEERVAQEIEKTGDTPFRIGTCRVLMKGDVFLPIRALKELRREGVDRLRDALLTEGTHGA